MITKYGFSERLGPVVVRENPVIPISEPPAGFRKGMYLREKEAQDGLFTDGHMIMRKLSFT